MLSIRHITKEGQDLDTIRQLFRDYEKELDADLCFQSFEDELRDPLMKYGPPSGDLMLARWQSEVAGCIALSKLNDPGACEMKRLYVKPAFRKNRIGQMLVEELLKCAREKKYKVMRLDTLRKLGPAINLYKKYGFIEVLPYYPNPLDGVVYMEKNMTP